MLSKVITDAVFIDSSLKRKSTDTDDIDVDMELGFAIEPDGIEYGIHKGLSEELYFRASAVNATFVKAFSKPENTMLHLKSGTSEKAIAASTAAIGTMVHASVLENRDVEFEMWSGQTRQAGFKAREAELAQEGKKLLTPKEYDAALGAIGSVRNCKPMRWFLDHPHTEKELSIFVKEPVYDMTLKARADAYNRENGYLVDLKTCASAAPEVFVKAVYDYGYDLQFAFYERAAQLAGLPVKQWSIFCVEKKAPFATNIFTFGEEAKEIARANLERLLVKIQADINDGNQTTGWPEFTIIEPPAWKKLQFDNFKENG